MIGVVILALGVALLWWYYPGDLAAVLAPETGGGGGAPAPSSDTPSTPPTLAPALAPSVLAIVRLVLQLAGDQDPAIILGIIERESKFDPNATNPNDPGGGAWGLMQMLASTAAQFGVADPRALLDPAVAIAAGVRYLDWIDVYLARRTTGGDLAKIAAWNEGVGNVVAGVPDPVYVQAVVANAQKWRAWLDSSAVA